MMALKLAYIGVEASRIDKWQEFGELVGLQAVSAPNAVFLRMDEKARRFIVTEGKKDDFAFAGFEVDSVAEFNDTLSRFERLGISYREGDSAGATLRDVDRYVAFHDPEGLQHEIVLGSKNADTPFDPKEMTDGFVTGKEGLGHVAINCKDYLACEEFMTKAMGAGLSDHIFSDFGESQVKAAFLHLNPRHHSIAYAQFPFETSRTIDHIMIEAVELTDVLKAQARVMEAGIPITITLGEHPNDHAVSFYCSTPSGFRLELASRCIKVTPGTWKSGHYDYFSMWGHRVSA
jgi:2,3-dihydroxybiphenyl 1,2-dioxygenase